MHYKILALLKRRQEVNIGTHIMKTKVNWKCHLPTVYL